MEARRTPTGCTKGDLAGENGLSQRCAPWELSAGSPLAHLSDRSIQYSMIITDY